MKDIHFRDGFMTAIFAVIIIGVIGFAIKSLFPSVGETMILDDGVSDIAETSLISGSETAAISESSDSGIININTATRRELQKLEGIGETKARAIIDYREQNGEFSSVDELVNVSGIGEKTLEKIRANITV